MFNIAEVVKVSFSDAQNLSLQTAFKEFYRLLEVPKIKKTLFIDKSSYQKFLNKQLRDRTPYQPDKPFSQYSFNEQNLPFLVVHSKIEFLFPSGREISLTEYLDEPNGLTKSVDLHDTNGESASFERYTHAEAEVLNRFLEETKKDG